jgi:DNA-binding MarR family transcriptional regulator
VRERLRELAEEMSREAFDGLSDDELEIIQAALARVRDNIARRDDAQQVTA